MFGPDVVESLLGALVYFLNFPLQFYCSQVDCIEFEALAPFKTKPTVILKMACHFLYIFGKSMNVTHEEFREIMMVCKKECFILPAVYSPGGK